MASQESPRSQTLFNAAVLVACFALVLGVAGIFYFRAVERTRQARRPPDRAAVLLVGPRDPAALEVQAHWREIAGEDRSEVGTPSEEPHVWLFREAPEARPLTVTVFRLVADRRIEIARQPAILTRGALFEVRLGAFPATGP